MASEPAKLPVPEYHVLPDFQRRYHAVGDRSKLKLGHSLPRSRTSRRFRGSRGTGVVVGGPGLSDSLSA